MGKWSGADAEHGRETEKVPSGRHLLQSVHRWSGYALASSGRSNQRGARGRSGGACWAQSLTTLPRGGSGPAPGAPPPRPAAPLTGSRAWTLGAPRCSPQRTQAASGASSQVLGNSGGGQGAVGRTTDTGLHSPSALWPQLPMGPMRASPHPPSPSLVWKPALWGPSSAPHHQLPPNSQTPPCGAVVPASSCNPRPTAGPEGQAQSPGTFSGRPPKLPPC